MVVSAAFLALSLLVAGNSWAASCTDGTDCYCDLVGDNQSSKFDANVIFCEDYEAVTLYDDPVGNETGTHTNAGGENVGGPWYTIADDPSPASPGRGWGSYWERTYGNSDNNGWAHGEPGSPRLGSTCTTASGTGECLGSKEYCSAAQGNLVDGQGANCWNANTLDAQLDIQRHGDHNDEIGTLTAPTGATGGATSSVFDGVQTLAFRNPPDVGAGIQGTVNFTAPANLGITFALAYSSSIESSLIWSRPWKHDEWGPLNAGAVVFYNASGITEDTPFRLFIFHGLADQAACESQITNGMTVNVGSFTCSDFSLLPRPLATEYQRTTDWNPLSSWQCIRAYYEGQTGSNMRLRIWFNDTLIIDGEGIDASVMSGLPINSYSPNNFSNIPQEQGATPISESVYRYQDNMHITSGFPVSCEAIGFGASAAGDPGSRYQGSSMGGGAAH